MKLEALRMMKWVLLFMTFGGVAAADLGDALKEFAAYEYGGSKKVLHEARMSAFLGADDPGLRAKHEQLLLEFVQSDATLEARRQACLWLSDLATEAGAPVLTKLAEQDDFADVARMALDALKERSAADGAATSKTGRFRAEVLASDDPMGMLSEAWHGDDETLARVAMEMVVEGVASKPACTWLCGKIGQLSPQRQVVAMNVLLRLDAPEKTAVIRRLAQHGSGDARLAAIRHLGIVGGREDMERLFEWSGAAEEAMASAAREGLLAAPDAMLEEVLQSALRGDGPDQQARAIGLVAARGAVSFGDDLLRVVGDERNPNRSAAAAALGMAVPPEAFERVLKMFASAEGSSIEKELQTAVWTLARRQADYGKAAVQLRARGGASSEKVRVALESMAKRLETLKPEVPLDHVGKPPPSGRRPGAVLPPGKFDAVIPSRFGVAAYLNCGSQDQAGREGVTIECLNGEGWNRGPAVDPSLSLAFAMESLEFVIRGLEPGEDHLLGMTWWDSDLGGRCQSVWINGREVLPDARPIAYDEGRPTPARIQFPLRVEDVRAGSVKVSIRRSAGPNAVCSELWVAKRRRPAAEKQVLLVSGQDFPGHHWRKTGPVVAEIIEVDPRMEVTMCESPYALGMKDLDAYDAVFMHFKNYEGELPSTGAMHGNLERYVRGGGGMCLSHFACGAMEEWPEFVELSGRVWNGQGHDPRGPFTVRVVDKEHPVTRGLEDFTTDDELYFCLQGSPEIHLLCDAHSKVRNADQPQAFAFHPGQGRVFMSTLGHDVKAYEAGEVKQLYRQATAWAAGLDPQSLNP